ncbi:hypothetical protein [Streptomyces sp. NBC_00094]|uniref:hypothetical protein n=1 Tax=Streptomyces sp. NBC_00094 TaxID=2903620 RepID=UPI002255E058|nr:hypothetical protein [Streptomyces sp. NBC_00094]MCX5388438.1 hypothetical protein [Streptomyces sp. NBC_00094]
MQPEVMSALIATGGAVIGVAIGILGPLAAARIQARGAREQADATVAAAQHATKGQYRAVMDQQARQARRDVYSRFLDAVRVVEQAILRGPQEELRQAHRVLGEAQAQVEIEGPDEVQQAALEVVRSLTSWEWDRDTADRLARSVEALNHPDPSWSAGQQVAAAELVTAISAMEAAVMTASNQGGFEDWRKWRRFLVGANNPESQFGRRDLLRVYGDVLPSDDVSASFDSALARARDAAAAAVSAGVFSASPRELLVCLAVRGKVVPGADIHEGKRSHRKDQERFRSAARQALHEVPEL